MKDGEREVRTYRQNARSDSAERTRLAILDAARAVAMTTPLATLTLKDVADQAGVAVQTVLRRFHSRDGLIQAAIEHFSAQVQQQRTDFPSGLREAVDNVVAHYESWGDPMLIFLGQETFDPLALRITTLGRDLHDRWVTDSLAPRTAIEHRLLVVATDLYTWKLLRRDRELSAAATADHIHALCRAITEHPERLT